MAFYIAAILVSLVAILGMHATSVSSVHDWYNQFWWLDIFMHFVGGAWVACLLILSAPRAGFLYIVCSTIFVGVFWEALEYIFNVPFFGVMEASFADSLWILDTMTDIALAVVAATIVAIFHRVYTKHNV